MKGFTKKQNRNRYYLHRRVRQNKVAKLDVRERMLFMPMGIDLSPHKHEKKLVKTYGYIAQTEMFTE